VVPEFSKWVGYMRNDHITSSQVPQSCKVQTPYQLAYAMVQCLGDSADAKWLEPCFGKGIFIRALSSLGVEQDRITAIDIDRENANRSYTAQIIRGADFFQWSSSVNGGFDRIIGNPPYVRIRDLPLDLQTPALTSLAESNHKIDRTANYWLPFLVRSIELLSQDGSLSFVLPAAWEYSNYARFIRHEIGKLFSRVEVHRSLKPLFSGKQEGSIVLICEGFCQGPCTPIRYEHRNLKTLCDGLIANKDSRRHDKPKPKRRKTRSPFPNIAQASEIFTIRIGAVTGDSHFFLLTEHQRRELGLPVESLVRTVSRASQIRRPEIGRRKWQDLCNTGGRVWLFRPPEKLVGNPAVQAYLAEGGCDRSRYKIRSRTVWHQTPLPPNADGFMTGMSRFSPWICLNRMKGLTATNTLYIVSFHRRLTVEEKASWCLSLMHPLARDAASSARRVYGDGLQKLEPNDIASIPLVIPRTSADALEAYREALADLLKGNSEGCERTAEYWFKNQARGASDAILSDHPRPDSEQAHKELR